MSFNCLYSNVDFSRQQQFGFYLPRSLSRVLLPYVNIVAEDLIEATERICGAALNKIFKKNFYDDFCSRVDTRGSYFYVKDERGYNKENLLGVLGKGGSKKAILLEQGRALIIPNFDVDSRIGVIERWDRIVREEVKMSNILNSIGLLSPLSKQVTIFMSLDSTDTSMTAYMCESFESMGETQNLFIIDRKNRESSTWKNSLFLHKMDSLDEEKWDVAVSELVLDIAKIFSHKIPSSGDSLNVAIQKNPNFRAESSNPYKGRYFGFDFSSKVSHLKFPNPQPIDRKSINYVVVSLVDALINHEFRGQDVDTLKFKTGESFGQFFDRLEEKYTDQVILQIKEEAAPIPSQ